MAPTNGTKVDAQKNARAMVEHLFPAELGALRGFAGGESVTALACRRSLDELEAEDMTESMMWNLSALAYADAVQIWLTAEPGTEKTLSAMSSW